MAVSSLPDRPLSRPPPPLAKPDLPAMIGASAKLLEQVTAQQAAASRLSELSVACGGQPLALPELEQLAQEAGLKAVLWAMQAEMRGCAAGWLQGPLFELDVADMQSKVGVLSLAAVLLLLLALLPSLSTS